VGVIDGHTHTSSNSRDLFQENVLIFVSQSYCYIYRICSMHIAVVQTMLLCFLEWAWTTVKRINLYEFSRFLTTRHLWSMVSFSQAEVTELTKCKLLFHLYDKPKRSSDSANYSVRYRFQDTTSSAHFNRRAKAQGLGGAHDHRHAHDDQLTDDIIISYCNVINYRCTFVPGIEMKSRASMTASACMHWPVCLTVKRSLFYLILAQLKTKRCRIY
jgi:hypothetical protein